jgi:hypothetical protein
LAQNPGQGRDARQARRWHGEQDREPRRRSGQATQRLQILSTPEPPDQTRDQEEVGLHHDMVRGVENCGRQGQALDRTGGGRRHRQTQHDVADLADDVEPQNAPDVELGHRSDHPEEHGQRRHPQQQRGQLIDTGEHQGNHPQKCVDADLVSRPANSADTATGGV